MSEFRQFSNIEFKINSMIKKNTKYLFHKSKECFTFIGQGAFTSFEKL